VSRKNKSGRARCGKCYRVVFAAVRRVPTRRELETLQHVIDYFGDEFGTADRVEVLLKLVGSDALNGDDAEGRFVRYCKKCSIRYEPLSFFDRLSEQIQKREDLVLTISDVKTRRA
jgi:hypothetical protein